MNWLSVGVSSAALLAACGTDAAPSPRQPSYHGSIEVKVAMRSSAEFGRIDAVAVGPGDRVFVADDLDKRIRVLGPTGKPVLDLGGRGAGPGEFRSINGVFVHGDTLIALDPNLQRITRYHVPIDSTPAVVRTISTVDVTQGRQARRLLVVGGGTVYAEYQGIELVRGSPGDHQTLVRRVEPGGGIGTDTVLIVPDRQWLVTDLGDGQAVEELPFGKRSILRGGPSHSIFHIWIGSPAVTVYAGGNTQELHVPLESRSVSQRDLEGFLGSIRDAGGPLAYLTIERLRKAWESGRIPEYYPCIEDFVVDDVGRVWITPVHERATLRLTDGGIRYVVPGGSNLRLVVDASSARYWTVDLPARFRIAAIAGNRIYGVSRDSLDVERVAAYDFRFPDHD